MLARPRVVRRRGRPRVRRSKPQLDEFGWSEVLARVAAAVLLVRRRLAAEAQAAVAVLVAASARLEVRGFLVPPAPCERRAVDVRAADPDPAEPRTRRAHVEVHLPARAEPVALVGRADRVDDLAADGVAEVRERVERLQRARLDAEPLCDVARGRGRIALSPGDALLVPGQIRGRPGEPVARIGVESREQPLEPVGRDDAAALEQDEDVRVAPRGEPVEAGRDSAWFRRRVEPDTTQREQRRGRRRVGTVPEHDELVRRSGVALEAPERRLQAGQLLVHVDAHADARCGVTSHSRRAAGSSCSSPRRGRGRGSCRSPRSASQASGTTGRGRPRSSCRSRRW